MYFKKAWCIGKSKKLIDGLQDSLFCCFSRTKFRTKKNDIFFCPETSNQVIICASIGFCNELNGQLLINQIYLNLVSSTALVQLI